PGGGRRARDAVRCPAGDEILSGHQRPPSAEKNRADHGRHAAQPRWQLAAGAGTDAPGIDLVCLGGGRRRSAGGVDAPLDRPYTPAACRHESARCAVARRQPLWRGCLGPAAPARLGAVFRLPGHSALLPGAVAGRRCVPAPGDVCAGGSLVAAGTDRHAGAVAGATGPYRGRSGGLLMAVVWRAGRDGVEYEVRRQGRTMRLYANGVQHSEFHPQRLVTGSVWDLLWLPVLLGEPDHLRRVLVLGLGGGSLIPPLRRLVDPLAMVAVELDPLHLEVAEQQFGVGEFGVETVCADAVEWVNAYDGPSFDLVV